MEQILTIPKNVNFGLEIEVNNIIYEEIERLINNVCNWRVYQDYSCGDKSAEVVSPVLNNKKDTIELLKKISKTLNHLNPTYDDCSFQINYDLNLFHDEEQIVYFLKLFSAFESIIFGFSKGNDSEISTNIDTFRRPITYRLNDYLRIDNEAVINSLTNNKHEAICIKKDTKKYSRDLIEFRTPNGTGDLTLWLNYINFFYYLINYAKRKNYNLIDELYEKNKYCMVESQYKIKKEEKAKMLSNMIYKTEKEKTLFLNQYLGKL